MEHADLAAIFMRDMATLAGSGMKFVLVHGGGPVINEMLNKLDIKSNFLNGLRITDAPTLQVVEMALCATANKEIVRGLQKCGISAAGVSGEDGKMLTARQKNAELGLVGEIVSVDASLPNALLASGFVPVIAPLALDAEGNPLNINADTAAGALAGALAADYFVLISDVPGIKDSSGNIYSYLAKEAINELRAEGTITGGMIPKVEACLAALDQGCRNALILDGSQPGSLRRYLVNNEPAGTVISA